MERFPSIPFAGDEPPCLTRSCSACCHDTEMLLTNEDVLRLSLVAPGQDFWFQADDGYLQLRTRDAPPVPGHAGRPCIFLADDGRCTVHDDRPQGCRLYPAIWEVDLRRATLDHEVCPHTDGFRLTRFVSAGVEALGATLERERQARSAGEAPSQQG